MERRVERAQRRAARPARRPTGWPLGSLGVLQPLLCRVRLLRRDRLHCHPSREPRAASRTTAHHPPPTPPSLAPRCSRPTSRAALTPWRRRPPRQAAAASHVHTGSHRQPQQLRAALRRRRHAARRLAARGQRRLRALVLRARCTLQGQSVGRVCLCRRRRADARGDRALVARAALRAGGGAHAPAMRAAGRAGVAHAPVQPHLCSVRAARLLDDGGPARPPAARAE